MNRRELIVSTGAAWAAMAIPPATLRRSQTRVDPARLQAVLDEAAKANITIEPRSGSEVAKIVADMFVAPPEVVEQMAKAIKPQ